MPPLALEVAVGPEEPGTARIDPFDPFDPEELVGREDGRAGSSDAGRLSAPDTSRADPAPFTSGSADLFASPALSEEMMFPSGSIVAGAGLMI